jgi:polyphosphate kinase
VQGLSENIRVISIVGRFLEHARVLYFKHGGLDSYFITSADIMPRNLDRRVELMAEITDIDMKASMEKFLSVSLADNKKAWQLYGDKYTKIIPSEGEAEVNSQIYFLENEI